MCVSIWIRRLVDHNISTWGRLLGVFRVGVGLSLIHLHVLLSALLTFLFLVFVLALLDVDFLAAGFGSCVVICGGAGRVVGASHLHVLALSGGAFCGALGLCFLLLLFLGTVLVAVGNKVGLWLVRGELGGCRFLRIPKSHQQLPREEARRR